jgi:hypothetical protein
MNGKWEAEQQAIRDRINKDAGNLHLLCRQILGIDWYDCESQARQVIRWIDEQGPSLAQLVEKHLPHLQTDHDLRSNKDWTVEGYYGDGTQLYKCRACNRTTRSHGMPLRHQCAPPA